MHRNKGCTIKSQMGGGARLYGVDHMVKNHSDCERGNPCRDVSVAEWLAWLTSKCGRIGAIGSSPCNGLKPNL